MPANSVDSLLPQIVAIARQAGDGVLQIYTEPVECEYKSDGSPLTRADTASHDIIISALQTLGLHYPILSEEGGDIPYEERRLWHRYWLIDPLDGTREFISRNGEFTVNIALIEQGVPILGVIYAPALQLLYYAAAGVGAYKQAGLSEPLSLHVAMPPAGQGWRILISRSHINDATRAFIEQLGTNQLLSMGSSLKLCLVAEGQADLYPRLAPTAEWDTAAGQCVLEQAGGSVVTTELKPLVYNARSSLLNPGFIACYAVDLRWSKVLPTQADEQ